MPSSSTSTAYEEPYVDPVVAEAADLAARGEKHELLDEAALFSTDDFRMYCLKIMPCAKRFTHDWVTCNFCHSGEKAKRRDPRFMPYTGIACPFMKKAGSCPHGDKCPYAHNVFEYWLHPTRYRTQLCNDGMNCRRRVCFFAHSTAQLRVPAAKPFVGPEVLATLASGSPTALQNPSPAVLEALRHISDSWQSGTRGTGEGGSPSREGLSTSHCLTAQEVEARMLAFAGAGVAPEVTRQLLPVTPSSESSIQGRLSAALQALRSSDVSNGDDQAQLIDGLQMLLHDALLVQQLQQKQTLSQQQPHTALQGSPHTVLQGSQHNGSSLQALAAGRGTFDARRSSEYSLGSSNGIGSCNASPASVGLLQAAQHQAQAGLMSSLGNVNPGGITHGYRLNSGTMLPQLGENHPVLQQDAVNGCRVYVGQRMPSQNASQNGRSTNRHMMTPFNHQRRSLQYEVVRDESLYPRRRSLQVENTQGSLAGNSQSGFSTVNLWSGLPEEMMGLGHASGGKDIGQTGAGMAASVSPELRHLKQQQQQQLENLNMRAASLDASCGQNPYWYGGPSQPTGEIIAAQSSLDSNVPIARAESVADGRGFEFHRSSVDLGRPYNDISNPELGRKQTQSLPVVSAAALQDHDATTALLRLKGMSLSNAPGWPTTIGNF